jgi:hypothetical protein
MEMVRRKNLGELAAERQRLIPLVETMADMKPIYALQKRIANTPCRTDADPLALLSILLEDSAEFTDHFAQRTFERYRRGTMANHSIAADRHGITPRGLRREQAAFYIGISPSKFDSERKAGKIPPPKPLFGVMVYDRHELDVLFDGAAPIIAANDNNEWDSVHASA